jgi:hypothetical protein
VCPEGERHTPVRCNAVLLERDAVNRAVAPQIR